MGLNQQQLGEQVGASRQTISLIERGDYHPSVLLALRIAKVFGAQLEEVFYLQEEEHADLFAGAIAHRFFDVVARPVAEQAIDPAHQLPLGLAAELRLAVEGPAHQPVGIGDRHNAAGDHLAAERVALADFLHIRRDAVVQRGNGGRHPVALLGVVAKFVRVAKSVILCGNFAPHELL